MLESIVERDGLFYLSTNRNYRCVAKSGRKWIGGIFDEKRGQFSDGRNCARGMSKGALLGTYTETFTTKRDAMNWVNG